MLAIKLSRFGKTKQPTYRLLVLEKTKDPWGDYLEMLGHYNPRSKELEFNAERIKYWLSRGAQPTDTVYNMLVSQGIISGKKRTVTRISKKRAAKVAEKQGQKAEAEKTAEKKSAEPADNVPAEPAAATGTENRPPAEQPAETPVKPKEETAPANPPVSEENPAEDGGAKDA